MGSAGSHKPRSAQPQGSFPIQQFWKKRSPGCVAPFRSESSTRREMFYYGSHELLVWEAVEFARRAKAAGVDVTLRSLSNGQHNFLLGAGRVPEVDQAIKEMAQWLRSKLRLPEARK
jgi:acetyl esterase/lipase